MTNHITNNNINSTIVLQTVFHNPNVNILMHFAQNHGENNQSYMLNVWTVWFAVVGLQSWWILQWIATWLSRQRESYDPLYMTSSTHRPVLLWTNDIAMHGNWSVCIRQLDWRRQAQGIWWMLHHIKSISLTSSARSSHIQALQVLQWTYWSPLWSQSPAALCSVDIDPRQRLRLYLVVRANRAVGGPVRDL